MKDIEDLVTEVYLERVFNLGSYETMRIGLKATAAPDKTPAEIIRALDKYTVQMRKGREAS
jgi:proteasome assembly chaperone (PAC2) family protein